jgi:hypothetical protein
MEVCKEALGEVEGEVRGEIVKEDSQKGSVFKEFPGRKSRKAN